MFSEPNYLLRFSFQINPSLLPKKDIGRPTEAVKEALVDDNDTLGATGGPSRVFGKKAVARTIAGAEVLTEKEQREQEEESDDEDEEVTDKKNSKKGANKRQGNKSSENINENESEEEDKEEEEEEEEIEIGSDFELEGEFFRDLLYRMLYL